MSNVIARKIESIENKGGMKSIDIANVIGSRPETVSRWNRGIAFPHPDKERLLLDLEYIVDLLSDLYDPLEARVWLFSRQRVMDGARPVELIQTGHADKVIEVLDQMNAGVYL